MLTNIRPLCEHPQLIFNRGCFHALWLHCCYYINGHQYLLDPLTLRKWINDCDYKYFAKLAHSLYNSDGTIKWDDIPNYYVIDADGEQQLLFSAISCGKCSLCQEIRRNDFSTRVNMEGATSFTRPVMVTLTYANQYMPLEIKVHTTQLSSFDDKKNYIDYEHWEFWKRGSRKLVTDNIRMALYKRDIELFFKRIRKKWAYYNYVPSKFVQSCPKDWTFKQCAEEYRKKYPFRYVVVGEYGEHTGHPHYHLVLFNLPYDCFNYTDTLDALHLDILKAWGKCIKKASQCEYARDAGRYVGKYISKSCPNGRKGFCHCSNRGGGIGSRLIDSYKEYFHSNPFVNKIGFMDYAGQYQEYTLGRYATRRLFPSFSRQYPASTPQYIRQYLNELGVIKRKYKLLGALSSPVDDLGPALSPHPYRMVTEIPFGLLPKRDEWFYTSSKPELTTAQYNLFLENELAILDIQQKSLILDRLDMDFPKMDDVERQLVINKKHYNYLMQIPKNDYTIEAALKKTAIKSQIEFGKSKF